MSERESSNQPQVICLIPARGGSKRLPRKNLALFAGKPLLEWTISVAHEAEVFAEIIVSSEDEEILRVAKNCAVTPMPRESSLAGDDITVSELCINVLEARAESGLNDQILYVMLPTSPLRTFRTVRKALELFLKHRPDTLLSVTPSEYPPQWSLVKQERYLKPLMPEHYSCPRSGIEACYRHDGGHLILDVKSFLKRRDFLGQNTIPLDVPPEEAVDIDEPEDLLWAEFLLSKRIRAK